MCTLNLVLKYHPVYWFCNTSLVVKYLMVQYHPDHSRNFDPPHRYMTLLEVYNTVNHCLDVSKYRRLTTLILPYNCY